jgi:hypothetical protein
MFGREPIKKFDGGDYALDLNGLRREVSRLGKWRAQAPLHIQASSTGFNLSIAGVTGSVVFGFAVLLQQINPNGSGTAQPYIVNNPPDGNWEVDTASKDNITCYAPPTLNANEYYPANTTVTVAYNASFQRWVILSSPYCSC